MNEIIRRLAMAAATSWRERRNEDGGLTDEVAMIAILVFIAVTIGGILVGVLSGAIGGLDFSINT